MDRTLALKGPISRGESLQFRIAMDGLTENRRDIPLAKSRLALALSQVCLLKQLVSHYVVLHPISNDPCSCASYHPGGPGPER